MKKRERAESYMGEDEAVGRQLFLAATSDMMCRDEEKSHQNVDRRRGRCVRKTYFSPLSQQPIS